MLTENPLTESSLTHAALKQSHRLVRDEHPVNLRLRVHRALSWLNRAEQAEDVDGKFIFLWIAFNAAYAQELFDDNNHASGTVAFTAFLEKLCDLDTNKHIDKLVWKEFSQSVRVLLDNPYVFSSFWDFQRGKLDESGWKKRFASAKEAASLALKSGNTAVLLSIVFNRLYTLRNQLIHGGATWDGKVNRDQLRDCTRFLSKLVPVIIALMMDNPNALWGDAVYPVVEQGV
ncbi:MAG: hypothetical protein LBB65_03965 [Burkholderiales bacterium]|nr:hypothetical protein [Burkholderiales bacterium]